MRFMFYHAMKISPNNVKLRQEKSPDVRHCNNSNAMVTNKINKGYTVYLVNVTHELKGYIHLYNRLVAYSIIGRNCMLGFYQVPGVLQA